MYQPASRFPHDQHVHLVDVSVDNALLQLVESRHHRVLELLDHLQVYLIHFGPCLSFTTRNCSSWTLTFLVGGCK